MGLQWIAEELINEAGVLFPLGPKLGPFPSACGYLNRHAEDSFARGSAMKSRDAFVPLMALCTFAIACAGSADGTLRWMDILKAKSSLEPSWFEDLTHSDVANLSIPRVGVFLNPSVEELKGFVRPMLLANVPIWIHWGMLNSPKLDYLSSLKVYRPNKDDIEAATSEKTVADLPKGSRQLKGENWKSYFQRMAALHLVLEQKESHMQRGKRLDRERHSRSFEAPGKKGATVFYWEEYDSGFRFRRQVPRADVEELWETYASSQKRYDDFWDEWDICSEFDPDAIRDDDDNMVDMPPTTLASPIPLTQPDTTVWMDVDPNYQPESVTPPGFKDTVYAVAQFRYGITVDSPGGTVSSRPEWPVACRALGCTAPESDAANNQRLRVAIMDAVGYLLDASHRTDRLDPIPLCDLHIRNPNYILRRREFVTSIRSEKTGAGLVFWIDAINLHPSRNAQWRLIVEDPVTALECLRRRWGPHSVDIAYELYSRGCAFQTCILSNCPPVHDRPVTIGLGYRLSGYKPCMRDYVTYEGIRNNFLTTPRARAALLKGGIVWRLAREVVSDAAVALGPSSEVYGTGRRFSSREGVFWDDDLSEDELDLICGVYKVFTGGLQHWFAVVCLFALLLGKGLQDSHMSWWPKHSTWIKSSLNTGYWSDTCEKWFQLRLSSIRSGEASLRSGQNWSQSIDRLENRAKRFFHANRELATQVLVEQNRT